MKREWIIYPAENINTSKEWITLQQSRQDSLSVSVTPHFAWATYDTHARTHTYTRARTHTLRIQLLQTGAEQGQKDSDKSLVHAPLPSLCFRHRKYQQLWSKQKDYNNTDALSNWRSLSDKTTCTAQCCDPPVSGSIQRAYKQNPPHTVYAWHQSKSCDLQTTLSCVILSKEK
jgi:hypothetical protein